ncbi:MAG: 6-carboxytetrahydropterin synthase [Eubacteriales bacterium]|jgi:6-pyruvoyltetrahydropterin/6-carboxytetrahydropterin synthase|nr:6-carboxytetrahydropterin synthase [Eubacteriales bacterium]MDD3290007.1 6-carboxytetrahydropterin synthase [Eubacteriales bacterium]MDD3863571.1 6-carboxytetrahydropterin synthase [Eubacteriales bacterium]MDD4445611.1 6-carboxytetrahydropterin synthase [Eubacteriales bacterium]
MKYSQYRFKFYLNTSHYIQIQGKPGQTHSHTWEISLDMLKVREGFVQFHEIEERIDQFIMPFQDAVLNETPPFDLINPTLENCCEYFKDSFQEILSENGWLLLMISMSETPTRAYVISIMNEDEETVTKATNSLIDNVLDEIKKADKA